MEGTTTTVGDEVGGWSWFGVQREQQRNNDHDEKQKAHTKIFRLNYDYDFIKHFIRNKLLDRDKLLDRTGCFTHVTLNLNT